MSAGFLSAATLGFLERLAARAAGEGCGRWGGLRPLGALGAVRGLAGAVAEGPRGAEASQKPEKKNNTRREVTFLQTRGFFAREAPELLVHAPGPG